MPTSNKISLEILDRYYSSALKSDNDKMFFLCVADYVKFIDGNLESNRAISQLLTERGEEYKIQAEYESKAIDEIKSVLDKLKSLSAKYKAITEEVNQIFLENEKYERGDIKSTESEVDRLFGYVTKIVQLLRKNGGDKQVSQYIKTDPVNSDIVISYSISEAYDRYTEERELMKFRSNFILGNEWNNLVWAYNTNELPRGKPRGIWCKLGAIVVKTALIVLHISFCNLRSVL